jgi:hypothetical protein
MLGKAAIGMAPGYFVLGAKRKSYSRPAKLLVAGLALVAFQATVDKAADGDMISFLVFCDGGSGLHDAAYDFMTGHHGEAPHAPITVNLVQVRVADAAVENFNCHVIREKLTALEIEWT